VPRIRSASFDPTLNIPAYALQVIYHLSVDPWGIFAIEMDQNVAHLTQFEKFAKLFLTDQTGDIKFGGHVQIALSSGQDTSRGRKEPA
jgi:hypothetical protein